MRARRRQGAGKAQAAAAGCRSRVQAGVLEGRGQGAGRVQAGCSRRLQAGRRQSSGPGLTALSLLAGATRRSPDPPRCRLPRPRSPRFAPPPPACAPRGPPAAGPCPCLPPPAPSPPRPNKRPCRRPSLSLAPFDVTRRSGEVTAARRWDGRGAGDAQQRCHTCARDVTGRHATAGVTTDGRVTSRQGTRWLA